MPKVSVVVPVYNMEKYLQRCMDALQAQTLSDLQIILVDDGSSDGSPKLCDDLALFHPGVETMHQKNGGLTAAWKAGCRLAKGEYIGFVDADDYIDPEMFKTLYDRAKEKDADIVCCGLVHEYEDDPDRSWTEQMGFPKDSYEEDDLRALFSGGLINDGHFMGRPLMPNRVTKIVKRSLLLENMDLCSDEVSIGEDFQFSLAMFLSAKRVEIVRDFFPYHYYMQNASMTMHHDPDYMDKIAVMRKNLLRIAKEKGYPALEQEIWNDFLCLTVLHVKAIVYKQKDKSYEELKKEMQRCLSRKSVMYALGCAKMKHLSVAERLFIFFMQQEQYRAIYTAVRVYFSK